MKTTFPTLRLVLPLAGLILASCSTSHQSSAPKSLGPVADAKNPGAMPIAPGKSSAATNDELDEYAATEVSDPLEGLNRATFWCNDKLYLVVFRPLSKGYEKVLPSFLRKGIDNAFENARFPVRFVNSALQGKFKRAGKETEKLLINTIAGLGGLMRISDKVPSLVDLPAEDTGQTLAVWGIGHGAYIVLPFFGPSSVREGLGMAGDYALNPINWGTFLKGNHDWTLAVQGGNSLRSMPDQFSEYDAATKDAVDPYISVRSAYVQHRAEAARK